MSVNVEPVNEGEKSVLNVNDDAIKKSTRPSG